MKKYILKRLAFSVPTILGVVVVVFFSTRMIPGDPAETILGANATQSEIQAYRHQLGLDQPLIFQLGIMLRDYSKGNMGVSITSRRPVAQEIIMRFPHTFRLAVAGMLISSVAGILLGVMAATKRNSWLDVLILSGSTAGIAAPGFWLGLLLSMIFALKLRWFPTIGAGHPGEWLSQLRALVLPAVTLGIGGTAFIARMTRSSMLEVLKEDYIRTARAKGLAEGIILFQHALKNAAIPTITVIGFYFGLFLGGTVIIETVFARPGLGKLLVDALFSRDYPIIQGVTLFFAMTFVVVNLLTDLLYSVLDPRIRQQ